jgi:DNA invertase Pin-like site-specific DNA recombinase
MTKITPEHLGRQAIVYIRQSTADQVANNLESQRRQYGLADRARQFGWSDVAVIDDDLGRSGGGVARPGFEKLLAAICEGRVGAVVSIEASRLARNGRDWHTLLEFCGLVGTLILDEDGVYDPRHPNDRLLLGMKGTMSEMELSVLRQRSLEALKQKARRGELFMTVAIGYVRIGNNRIEMDPDRRIVEAIALAFAKFAEMQSVRQVHLWLRHERIPLPAVTYSAEGRLIEWKLPVYNTVLHILTNPIYAGAYAFGRTGSRVSIEAGRKKVVRGFKKERKDWEVLIPNHHEGYLSWADYERNLGLIADNANGKNPMSRGALRRGEALLAGLLRCGHCGRKLHVAYSLTLAPMAIRAAITVRVALSITAAIAASRLEACALTGMSVPRSSCAYNRSESRQRSRHRLSAAVQARTSDDRSSWRWNRLATRSATRVANMMPSIPTTASSPPSWRRDGMSD